MHNPNSPSSPSGIYGGMDLQKQSDIRVTAARREERRRIRAEAGQPLRFITYGRVSEVNGRSGGTYHSVEIHHAKCRAAAAHHDVEIVEEIVHEDFTGVEIDRLDECLSRIECGEIDGLIVTNFARFARRVRDTFWAAVRVRECGGDLISADEAIDIHTAVGNMILANLAAVAELQWEMASENWWLVAERNMAAGVASHQSPFGYRKRDVHPVTGRPCGPFVIEQFEARYVRQFYELHRDGVIWEEIARRIDADPEAPRGRHGSRWTGSSVAYVVRNPVNKGWLVRDGFTTNEAAHEAIVTDELWAAGQSPSVDHAPRSPWPLMSLTQGLLRCAGCCYSAGRREERGTGELMIRCKGTTGGGRCPEPVNAFCVEVDEYVEAKFLTVIRDQVDGDFAGVDGSAEQALAELRGDLLEAEANLEAVKGSTGQLIRQLGEDEAMRVIDLDQSGAPVELGVKFISGGRS
jgi:DNA invertase Pin-like site-specific DNA recombinase